MKYLLFVLLLGGSLSAQPQPARTVAEVINEQDRFSILAEALVLTRLDQTLAQQGPFTLFAPTNAAFRRAFDRLGISDIEDLPREQLTGLLLYHVIEGRVLSEDLRVRQTVPTLATPTLDIVKRSDTIIVRATFSRARVVRADIRAANGVVHAVNNVLLSIPPVSEPASDIVTTLRSDANFTQLTALLEQTGLDSDLAQGGPFTLFAPTDAAFNELFAVLDSQQIVLSSEQLTGLLRYHVGEGKILSTDLAPQQTVPTLATPTLDITKRGERITVEASFSEAQVEEADIAASNGVIHAVDAVLLSIPGLLPEPEEPSINVFPNRFSDVLNIDIRGYDLTTVRAEIISLVDNRKVLEQEVAYTGGTITLNVSSVAAEPRPYVLLLSSDQFTNVFLIQKEP